MLTVTYQSLDSKISYMDEEKSNIGKRIKQARLAFKPRKMTQQQLANAVNVSRPVLLLSGRQAKQKPLKEKIYTRSLKP